MRKFFGIILLIVGVLLLLYPQVEHFFYNQEQSTLLEDFEEIGQTEVIEQLSADEEDVFTLVKRMKSSEREKSPDKKLEGATGIIQIESIDLEMVLFDNASAKSLGKGAGIVEPSEIIGVNNVGIAGHRAIAKGKQFNRLDELVLDDVIEVTTKDGNFQFEVVKKFVVHESQVSVLNETGVPQITLITCTPIGKKNPEDRLIVQAELVVNEVGMQSSS